MTKISPFPLFFAVSVCTFWILDFFSFFFSLFRLYRFFAVSTPANTCKGRQIQNLLTAEKHIASNNFWKGNNFYIHWKMQVWVISLFSGWPSETPISRVSECCDLSKPFIIIINIIYSHAQDSPTHRRAVSHLVSSDVISVCAYFMTHTHTDTGDTETQRHTLDKNGSFKRSSGTESPNVQLD